MRITPILIALALSATATSAIADTLQKVRDTGRFVIGFREDARPFAYRDEDGEAAGFSVDLCRAIAEGVKLALQMDDMTIDYVPVPADKRLEMVTSGEIDIECGSSTHTLERRGKVSFTLSTFATGAEMLLAADSPIKSFADLKGKTVGVLNGTTTEAGLRGFLKHQNIDATVDTVARHEEGLQLLKDGKVDAYFGDRILLVGLMSETEDPDAFRLSGEFYSYEPYAFMVRRNDETFLLIADGMLSEVYRSGQIWDIYKKHFRGAKPSELLMALYVLQGIPVR